MNIFIIMYIKNADFIKKEIYRCYSSLNMYIIINIII